MSSTIRKIEEKSSLTKLCRSCGSETDTNISIETAVEITKEKVKYTLKKLIELTTSVPVKTTDGLSQVICHKCMYELINAYMFINKFKKTNVNLNNKSKIMAQSTTKDKNVYNATNSNPQVATSTNILKNLNPTNTKGENIQKEQNPINRSIITSSNNLQTSSNPNLQTNVTRTFIENKNVNNMSKNSKNTFINQSTKEDSSKHEMKNIIPVIEDKENVNISDLTKIKPEPLIKTEIKNEDDIKVEKYETYPVDSDICEEDEIEEEEEDDLEEELEEKRVIPTLQEIVNDPDFYNDLDGWVSAVEDMELMSDSDSVSDTEWNTTCYICDKEFDNRKKYRKHIIYHKKTKKSCPFCGHKFHYSKQLQYHLKFAHGAFKLPSQNVCDCGKKFGSAANLKRHQKTHADKNVSGSSKEK